jgi:hypothetical protein
MKSRLNKFPRFLLIAGVIEPPEPEPSVLPVAIHKNG